MSTDNRAMGDLYRTLAPTERSRLVARFVREDNMAELRRVRDSLPEAREVYAAYNRALHLSGNLPLTLTACCEGLRGRLWYEQGQVYHFLSPHLARRRALLHMHDLWRLLPYPITEREYHGLIAQERGEVRPLTELVQFISEFSGDEAPTLCPAAAAWVGADPAEGETEEDASATVQALIETAILAGTLPALMDTPEGPGLPWGVFTDWLYHREPTAYKPYGPEYHVAAIYVLGGLFCTWDVRPDREAARVRQRRQDIITALARVGALSPDQIPTADPPASVEDRERQRDAAEAHWPWHPDEDDAAEALRLSYAVGSLCRETQGLSAALNIVQRDEFGGEDPLPPYARALVSSVQAQAENAATLWADLRTDGHLWPEEWWPALPEPIAAEEQERQRVLVEMLTNI